ncbi:MAG: hypothetical protein JWO42_3329 [Chloroflexi bacterium]|jgi:hypothetical protein|nr:hypothetical protein [Chloroflexota bacterium]
MRQDSEVGTQINPRNFPLDQGRLVELSGLPRIRSRDLRHTYTTLALERGANLLAVSKQLGSPKSHARSSGMINDSSQWFRLVHSLL